ncbi:MAG: DNA primase, partial [Halioglobus sp.]|nr:DNA primase [Halioglobus sp.]
FYCFGCGAGGNALGFLMDYDNLEFPQAVQTLASAAGLEVPREASGPGQQRAAARERGNRALYNLLEKVAGYYQQQLRSHSHAARAVAYLKGRGLSGAIAKQFNLGFAPPGWDNLLAAMGDTDEHRALLKDSGMLVQNEAGRVYDRFRDRVVFPIRDQRGRVVAFGGRVLGDDKPKYLNSPETDIFHKGRELYGLFQARQANRSLRRILVVEGYMDVIALAQHGISNATATLGTATSGTHLERIYRLCPEVVFCFDGDAAGRKAAFRALEAALPCMEDGRQARFLFLPEGEDPDTVVRSIGAAGFERLLHDALPLETFLFESVAGDVDTATLEGRARLSKLALPYIRQLPEGVYRQLMFRELAQRTGLELSGLLHMQASPPPALPPGAAPPPLESSPASEQAAPAHSQLPRQRAALEQVRRGYSNLAQAAIALLLHQPDIARLSDPALLAELQGGDIDLLRELLGLLSRRPESNTAMLLGHWYGTPEGDLLNRLAGQERLIPRAGIERQFVDTMQALASLPQRSKLAAQVDKLKRANYAEISDAEKQRLRELLREKLQRDAQRKDGQKH